MSFTLRLEILILDNNSRTLFRSLIGTDSDRRIFKTQLIDLKGIIFGITVSTNLGEDF